MNQLFKNLDLWTKYVHISDLNNIGQRVWAVHDRETIKRRQTNIVTGITILDTQMTAKKYPQKKKNTINLFDPSNNFPLF